MINGRRIAVVGLGYVGLNIAQAFSQKTTVIGFDTNKKRITELKNLSDRNQELSAQDLRKTKILLTHNQNALQKADFYIIAVPTPVDENNNPDFSMLICAAEIVGKHLKKNAIVVFESTVYPGATEEICLPALEKSSHMIAGKDFFIGYSPERIDPGNKKHNIYNTIKIVSAQDAKTLEIIANVYSAIIDVGVYRASTIKVAEASKILENTQRDVNISLMNEVAMIFHRLDVDILEAINAAKTKWNFMVFYPGLVGGHCISVDPYYLTSIAEKVGYHPDVVLAGRRVNELIPKFIAESTIKQMLAMSMDVSKAKIAVFGLTFKENCPDLRNTKVIDIIRELKSYNANVLVHDPIADSDEVQNKFGFNLYKWDQVKKIDVAIFAVSHKQYVELSFSHLKKTLAVRSLIMDVKGILNPADFVGKAIKYWRL